jgi:pantetheine-phosphate adenylyltransferase
VVEWIEQMDFGREFRVEMLSDPYGPTLHEHFDCIVVSPETYPTALKLNSLRRQKNLPEILIIVVPFVLAEDGLPISSTRIAMGEID